VEFTLVFPPLIALLLGTVDITYLLSDWALANTATYNGARAAIVAEPVATGITNLPYDGTKLGQSCFVAATGASSGNCPTVTTTCTAAATNGGCTGGYAWNEAAFTPIFTKMQSAFPRLVRQDVQIDYQTDQLGFVGRPNGLPMIVTVRLQCVTHQLFFLPWLPGVGTWANATPTGCSGATAGRALPTFATSLPSEDMVLN
jgi:hypothetical protein